MKELRMYTPSTSSSSSPSNHTVLPREHSSSINTPLEQPHRKQASPETSKKGPKPEELIPSQAPPPLASPQLNESDRRYIAKAEECARHLVEAAKATEQDGWILMGTSKNVISMKKPPSRGGSGVSCAKGSTYVNVPPDFILRLLMDGSYACELDDLLKDIEEIYTVTDSIHLLHLHYKPVWPTTARDFAVLDVAGRVDENISVHAAVSITDPRIPEERGYVRGEVVSGGGYVIQSCPGHPNRSYITYITQVDLKGSVPMFVVNKVIESQPLCASQLRQIAEREYGKAKQNLQMLKELEEKQPIHYIVPEKNPARSSSPTPLPPSLPSHLPSSFSSPSLSSRPANGGPTVDQEHPRNTQHSVSPTQSLPVDIVAMRRVTPTPPPPPSDTQPMNEAGPCTSSSSSSLPTSDTDGQVMHTPEEIPAAQGSPPAVEDVFSVSAQPPLPLSSLLNKLPRYSAATESSSSEEHISVSRRTKSHSMTTPLSPSPRVTPLPLVRFLKQLCSILVSVRLYSSRFNYCMVIVGHGTISPCCGTACMARGGDNQPLSICEAKTDFSLCIIGIFVYHQC